MDTMSVLYQIVEQGRHTAFVDENGDGLAELHPLLARASAIAEDENSGLRRHFPLPPRSAALRSGGRLRMKQMP